MGERRAAYWAGPAFISSLVFDCKLDACSYGQVGFPLEVTGYIVEFTTVGAAAGQNGQKIRQRTRVKVSLTKDRHRDHSG